MKVERNVRDFEVIRFTDTHDNEVRVQQSSAIDDDLEGAFEWPGSSYLWLGMDVHPVHLDRAQIRALLPHLMAWAETGSLELPAEAAHG